jgi:hypothetical protein
MRNGTLLWNIAYAARGVKRATKGSSVKNTMGLVDASLKLGSEVFGNNANFDRLMGLDFKVTETNGKWTVNHARIKLMTQLGTGTGVSVGGVEANVKVGTFYDVSGVLNDGLKLMEDK